MTYPRLTIGLSVCILVMTSGLPAWAALEKSSKKECAMCHVMWLDVFRTDKETLIQWQPGNVLMKDTQGIVSAEEVCYSCHDGYVADSRHIAWKNNSHTTFKKPPSGMMIPSTLPLSNKDEIYCGTCHTPHAGPASTDVLSSGQSLSGGALTFLRQPNANSELCEACHKDQADYRRTNGHPLHSPSSKEPENRIEWGMKMGSSNATICQTCHRVHGAKGRNLVVTDNHRSHLCMACHDQKAILGTQHDLSVTLPAETNIKGQTVSDSGPCGACHLPHNANGYKLWARKLTPGALISGLCLSCHTNTPGSPMKGTGLHSHPNNVGMLAKDGKALHPLTRPEKLPLFTVSGKQPLLGSVQCVTCHNVHQWDPVHPDNTGGKDVEGDASNSFLRIPGNKTSALCVACHGDKKQLLSSGHNLTRTAPEAMNIRGETPMRSGPCGACHVPHHATGKNLWAREMPQDMAPGNQYCIPCHSETGNAKAKAVGKKDHPVNVAAKGPGIPLPAEISLALPLYSAAGELHGGDCMMCGTCHDPHIWSTVNEKTRMPTRYEHAADATVDGVEGDATNSFLRKPASPTPDLCVVCHPDTALLMGTDHDLFITAPEAKNKMGQTVVQSGACGVCHAAHNSPEQRLLWAQALGSVAENQHSMNGVCTGCHAKGAIAGEKTPPVATHTSGLLMNNILTHDHPSPGYIKIFNTEWKEVGVGDLSCPSCHSFYRWDHRVKQPGTGENVEGDVNTSFLRTSSDRTVCMDCHGETALWRYMYFHSPEKREMIRNRVPQ